MKLIICDGESHLTPENEVINWLHPSGFFEQLYRGMLSHGDYYLPQAKVISTLKGGTEFIDGGDE